MMTMTREAVYSAVDSERRYQDEKWPRLEPLSVVVVGGKVIFLSFFQIT